MKKEDLKKMIAHHEAALQRTKRLLDEYYYDLEARGEEMKWLNEFEKQSTILRWLLEQKADDE